jgi:hypothetical protein
VLGVGEVTVGMAGRDGPIDGVEALCIASWVLGGAFVRPAFVGDPVGNRLVDVVFVDG